MNIRRFMRSAVIMCLMGSNTYGQNAKLDPGFWGLWNLEVAKSDFASQGKPKAGQVNWGVHGFSFALVFADGGVFTDGIQTDHGCVYIGVTPLSCKYEVVTPRHVRLTMKDGTKTIRVGEIELLADGTTQTTHHVTPSNAAPYVEKTIWVREK
jgi:hypothetical protein